jgi:hypothetical protein
VRKEISTSNERHTLEEGVLAGHPQPKLIWSGCFYSMPFSWTSGKSRFAVAVVFVVVDVSLPETLVTTTGALSV